MSALTDEHLKALVEEVATAQVADMKKAGELILSWPELPLSAWVDALFALYGEEAIKAINLKVSGDAWKRSVCALYHRFMAEGEEQRRSQYDGKFRPKVGTVSREGFLDHFGPLLTGAHLVTKKQREAADRKLTRWLEKYPA